ncbi:MAG TPA: hypothetical protein DD979_01490 [Gammaproteobacteria bacterium]|jgi:hypothetical protein|nr:hypothetical protein [Gammaproteobacteria bacterium]
MIKHTVRLACLSLALAPLPLLADNDFDNLRDLAQDDFRTLSEDLAAATSYKAVSPAEPLGLLGFDIGLELTATKLDKDIFEDASAGDWDLGYLPLPKVHAHKGLPFNVDVGAFYAGAPGTDISLIGGEIRYSLLEGSIISPALAFRLTYSRLEGVDELELENTGIEVSISKGFAMLTPYAGVGSIRTTSEAVDVDELDEETFSSTKLFAGLNVNLGMNLGFEADVTGGVPSYSLKASLRF